MNKSKGYKIHYLIMFTAILAVFILFSFAKNARAATVTVEPDSGPSGTGMLIRVLNFCVNDPGTAVEVTWQGTVIGNESGPSFLLGYTVPQNTSPGQYILYASAYCATPSFYIEAATATFTVTSPPANGGTTTTTATPSVTSTDTQDTTETDTDDNGSNTYQTRSSRKSLDNDEEEGQNEQLSTTSVKAPQTPWYYNWVYYLVIGLLCFLVASITYLVKRSKNKSLPKN